jgi:hypothetical protein
VHRVQSLFGVQARLALEQQGLLRGTPARAQEQVREGRVRLIGTRVGERDLERRQQLQIERAIAGVAQLDLAKFDVVFRADPDGGAGLDLGPGCVETHAVGVVGALVVRGRVGRRVLGERDRLRLPIPAQVEEASMGVAQCVISRA